MVALVLSILVPGLGQFYYGRNIRALCMVLLGLTPLYPLVLIWTLIDIIVLNKKGACPVYKLKEALWVIAVLVLVVPLFIIVAAKGLFAVGDWYSGKYILPEQTIKEGNDIALAIKAFNESKGQLPDQIKDLTDGFPLRAGWLRDSWGETYHYEKLNDGSDFKLISKGPDRVLATKDDIIFK